VESNERNTVSAAELSVGARVIFPTHYNTRELAESLPGTVVEASNESEFVGVRWDHIKRGLVGRVPAALLEVVA
jgi:hypothetical protein